MTVSRETSERLQRYEDLVQRWNPRINLVAPGTLRDFQSRHIDDCLRITEITGVSVGKWVDLGSGGGLPGLVLAIALSETNLSFMLIESDQRKVAFLRTVIRELDLKNATVFAERIERLAPQNADYVSARALAPLPRLMAYLDRHLAPGGTGFVMKGRRWRTEVDDARKSWRFDCVSHSSRTEEGAAILEISGVSDGGS